MLHNTCSSSCRASFTASFWATNATLSLSTTTETTRDVFRVVHVLLRTPNVFSEIGISMRRRLVTAGTRMTSNGQRTVSCAYCASEIRNVRTDERMLRLHRCLQFTRAMRRHVAIVLLSSILLSAPTPGTMTALINVSNSVLTYIFQFMVIQVLSRISLSKTPL